MKRGEKTISQRIIIMQIYKYYCISYYKYRKVMDFVFRDGICVFNFEK